MRFEAVGFDYGGVLYGHTGPSFNRAIIQVLDVDEDTFRAAYFRYNKAVNRDEITWPELWKHVLDELGKSDKLNAVLEIDQKFHAAGTINQDVLRLTDKLRQQGYKVGLLSNNNAVLTSRLKQMGLVEHFDTINVSAITGLVKPEAEAFRRFAHDLAVDLHKLIFIDDSPMSLSTANECGFTPVLFETYDKLVNDLEHLGLSL